MKPGRFTFSDGDLDVNGTVRVTLIGADGYGGLGELLIRSDKSGEWKIGDRKYNLKNCYYSYYSR